MTYTLIVGIDLLEAVRRYGLPGRVGTVEDVVALPFTLHERSEQPAAGPILFIELQGGAYWMTVGGERGPNSTTALSLTRRDEADGIHTGPEAVSFLQGLAVAGPRRSF